MIISDTSLHAFEKISIDFYGYLNTTLEDYKYILTIQDCLSKYCILVPVKHANAEEVAKGLTEKMICYFGPPAALLTDQGTHFQNKLLDEFAKLIGINKSCTTAYHPQSNGSIERMHHTLTEYLRKYVENKTEWNT
jgi:transposase InsO family protein